MPSENAADMTTVSVVDVLGRTVRTLVHAVQPAGQHHTSFNGAELHTGQYYIDVITGTRVSNRLMVRVK